jgi:predicted NBD/HSP70 family sugar kinase
MTVIHVMRHDGSTSRGSESGLITTQTGRQPADFTDVRATNLAVVMRFVRANAPCSRADIAASTGLNKATVSSLVAELIDRRLLRETGLTEHRIGRPATMIVVDGQPYAAIGIEVNTDHLTAVAIDLSGERLLSWRRAFTGTHASPAKALANVAALARRAVTRVRADGRHVLGLAIGVAGLVDSDGVVRLAPNLGWRDVPARDTLIDALESPEYPVTVDNDANLAAQAEYRYGPYSGTPNLIYLSGHIGVGAGIVADGQLLRGGRGLSGEIGHVQLDRDGPLCECGRRGCLEAYAGIGALIRRISTNTDGNHLDLEPEVEDVVRRAQAQESTVLSALREVGQALGRGAAIVTNVVNPDVVILGGYYVPLAPWLLPAAEAALREGAVAPDAGGAHLVASALGHGATATGGAASVLDSIDSGRLPESPLT